MMIIHQNDYRNVRLDGPLPNLVITSIPLNQLTPESFFRQWINVNTNWDRLVILDVPHKLGITETAERTMSLEYHYRQILHHFYEFEKHQELLFFSNKEIDYLFAEYKQCNERDMKHECEFDDVLITELIEKYSEPNDVVLDPFCGTGLVPRIAHKLGRTGIGIDLRCPYTNEL